MLTSVLRPTPGGIGVSKLSMDTLRDASQAQNCQAGLSSSAPVGVEGKATEEKAAAGLLYRAAEDLGKGKSRDLIVLMDRLKDSLSCIVMLSLLGYVPSAVCKRLAGFAALCLRVKILIVSDQNVGATMIKIVDCYQSKSCDMGELDQPLCELENLSRWLEDVAMQTATWAHQ